MTKRDKREMTMRRNPKAVRYEDLDLVLRGVGFIPRAATGGGSSHVTYAHPRVSEIVTVVIPHGSAKFVKEYQVKAALDAIDVARAKE